jgi:hypothetical protein
MQYLGLCLIAAMFGTAAHGFPSEVTSFRVITENKESKLECNYSGYKLTSEEASMYSGPDPKFGLDSVRCNYRNGNDSSVRFERGTRRGARGVIAVTPMVFAYGQIMAIYPFPLPNQNQLISDGKISNRETIKVAYLNGKREEELVYSDPGSHARREDQILQRVMDIMKDVRTYTFKDMSGNKPH